MPEPETPWLDLKEAAAYLRVHPNTLVRWAQSGAVKAHKVGIRGEWRFKRPDLDAYVEAR